MDKQTDSSKSDECPSTVMQETGESAMGFMTIIAHWSTWGVECLSAWLDPTENLVRLAEEMCAGADRKVPEYTV